MLKQKTVYFREEDLPLWEAISNKAEWLHNALNGKHYLIAKVNDKLYVMNGQDPVKYYDATTEVVAPKDLHLPTITVNSVDFDPRITPPEQTA